MKYDFDRLGLKQSKIRLRFDMSHFTYAEYNALIKENLIHIG